MHSDFVACGMLPAGHTGCRQISHIQQPEPSQHIPDNEDSDSGPVEGQDILEDVILAHTHSMSISFIDNSISDSAKHGSIHVTLRAFWFT